MKTTSAVGQLAALCLSLAAACSRAPDHPDTRAPPARVPTPAPAAQALPTLLRARLDYMFEAAQLVAASWPGMTPQSTCLLIIDIQTQWVVNCELAPRGFERSAEHYRGHPVYAHQGGSFQSEAGSKSTAEFLATTPATAHVPGPDVASDTHPVLPGDNVWLIIGTLEALSAFHPAFEYATTEAWVSVAMHEFVHTHQLRAPGFAPQLAAIEHHVSSEAPLTALYTRDKTYRRSVQREYALLTRAAAHDPADRAGALRALRTWWSHYQERKRVLSKRDDGSRLIADDVLFSYIEGVARFVESDFLTNAAQHPSNALLTTDPRYHDYAAFLDKGYAGSPNRQLDDQYVYAIGYHVCALLERVDPRWKNSVHTRSHWLHDMVQSLAANGGGG